MLCSLAQFSGLTQAGKIFGHFNLINTITWLSCLFGWAHLGMLFGLEVYRKMVMASIQDYFDYLDTPSTLAVMSLSDSMAEFSSYQRIFISYAHILFMARCFLSLQWQPRLAIITSTLQATTVDLTHFLIVLIPTWFGFAIAGMIMFGRRMQAFSTPLSGFAMCLQLALEGEYDWGYMSSEDWFITLLWVWIYMVLLVMVMLNMVLAIIMDVYAEVRRQQGETMSIFQHCTYLFKRALYYKNWVPDRELWERVAEMPETIIVDDILEAYPNMPDFQLNFLCDGARNRTRVIQRAGIDPTYTVQMVAAIHISLEEIMMDLMKLKKRGWMGKGFEVPNDEDRNLVKEILAGIAVQSEWMLDAQKHVSWLHQQIGSEGADGAGYEWKATGPVGLSDHVCPAVNCSLRTSGCLIMRICSCLRSAVGLTLVVHVVPAPPDDQSWQSTGADHLVLLGSLVAELRAEGKRLPPGGNNTWYSAQKHLVCRWLALVDN
ncbi:pkd2 [Symbiodinium pilosum]|uniref:Pkd2 protein n=1 Tax=Symbiodinium pilosum TaxID=2952 RepID=A0A812WD90_SYMPI|nr:pkd2 [Symbiodinium pilosum]